jgi:3-keto-5-aminohexanoate cleavage enzyme
VSTDRITVTSALTGSASLKADNAAIPLSPAEIAADAEAVWRAGAAVVHVHARDPDGRPTADLDLLRETVTLIRQRCPVVIQLSTGVSVDCPYDSRARVVEATPDMISMSLATVPAAGTRELVSPPARARELAARALELGVGVDVELFDTGHIALALRLRDEGLLPERLFVTLVVGGVGRLPADPVLLARTIELLPDGTHWQIATQGRQVRRMACLAIALGGHARIGLEDYAGSGSDEPTNVSLVQDVAAIVSGLRAQLATADEVRMALGTAVPST